MSQQPNPIYELGPDRLDAAERLLSRGGEVVPLQPKAFDLLLALVERPGRLLEKDELMKVVWPDTVVEEVNLANNISILRKTLGANGQQFIETVPKRGYRFVADVNKVEEERKDTRDSLRGKSGGAIKSIAVLPFANADPNTEYLSDGITESLINSLSQLSQLKVIARTTAFRYKGKVADPKTVGHDLKIDAVLTGLVRQQGENLLVQVDLVNAADGAQLWGERYPRKLANILVVQEEIVRQVTERLRLRLSGAERKQVTKRHTENNEAFLLYSKGHYYAEKRTY